MDNAKSKILVLVEGEKTDVVLMSHLLEVYGIDKKHEIVSYNTNIYTLYNKMFKDGDPDSIDLLQLLREHEKEEEKKTLFERHYSDILLIFDLDPQDPQFSETKIREMSEYFVESSDMGKLYLNYPMVEAFYHMKSIPDPEYPSYVVSLEELHSKLYKSRVNCENRNRDYTKFAVDRSECNIVIKQNIEKAFQMISPAYHINREDTVAPRQNEILNIQLSKLESEQLISVLCTCAFYIVDYNPTFITQGNIVPST